MTVDRVSLHILGVAALLLALGACSDDQSPKGSTDGGANQTSGGSMNGPGDPDASAGGDASTSLDASTTGDGPSDAPPTTQTENGSCEGELLLRDYPITVSVTGLSVPDGTTVWGFASFGVDDYDFCSVLGETQVQDGAFTLSLTAMSTGGYFPDVAFWIDENGDRSCDRDSEIVFRGTDRGARSLTLELTVDDLDDDVINEEVDTACEPFELFVQP